MKLLYKYYRFRAKHATDAKKEHFRKMAWYASDSYQYGGFVGSDLTRFPDPQAMKEELTAGIGERYVDPAEYKFSADNHAPGRYADGPINMWIDEAGNMHDDTVWKETPQWWAEVPEANQQHQPTYRTPRERGTFTRFDPETGKRTYWKYDYKTGKQVQVK